MAQILLMVGTQKGAFMISSDERRTTWEVRGPLLKGWSVFDIALDQRGTPAMYAGVGHFVYGPAVHISHDLGKTWQQVEDAPKYESTHKLSNVWCIEPGRSNEPGVLYAGVDEAGIFVSRDSGLHWEELPGLSNHPTRDEWSPGAGGLCCHSILLDPRDINRMWVGISAVGVFRTDDAGKTWMSSNDGLEIVCAGETHKDIGTCVHHMVIDPRNPDRLFQQNHRGLFRSLNGGDTWERIENGIPNNFGFPMVMLPNDSATLYIVPQESDEFRFAADGRLTVYRTTNGGNSWHPLRNGLPFNAYVGVLRQAMAADSCDEPGVYFGTTGGQIFYSRDGGGKWEAMSCALPRINSVRVAVIE
ncbi:MAG: hypothetical protein WC655_17885 [Candidatus Hydrogenedentales bacterium]